MKARLAWTLFRASHPEPVVAVTAATALLTLASGRGRRRAVLATAAILSGQLFTGWTNDLLDAALDREAGRKDKPIATGELPAAVVAKGMAAALPLALLLSLLVGARAALIHGAGLALAGAYNLGLRATPFSFAPYAAAFALLPVFALGEAPPGWTLAAGALLGVAAHLAQVLPDIEADRAAGVLGLPQRLGVGRTAVGVTVLLAACGATIATGSRRRAVAALCGAGVVTSAAATAAGLHGRPRLAFRLTMAAAGMLGVAYAASLRLTDRAAAAV